MSVSTSHQLSRYYDFYRDKEVVFTKANLKFLRMDPRQIYLKCNGGQWPCIINSSSLQQAKVIIGTSSGVYSEIMKKQNMNMSIRYCFFSPENEPIQFFVNCVVFEVKQYNASPDLAIVTLNFTQRPPDDLISRIGEFVEINENFRTRREERIALNKNSMRELGLLKEESFVFISNVPRRCILKDLSFGGAKVMMVGIPKFLIEKAVDLRFYFFDSQEKLGINGKIVNAEFLPGRKDIVIAHIEYNENEVPMSYKYHINSYITSYQKQMIENQIINREAEEKAAAEAAAKTAALQAKIEAGNAAAAEAEKKEEEKKAAAKAMVDGSAIVNDSESENKVQDEKKSEPAVETPKA